MPTRRAPVRRKKKVVRRRLPQNAKLERRVRRLEHAPELKYHDTYNNTSMYNNTTTFILLSNMGQGDDVEERLGLEATVKFLNVKILLGLDASDFAERWRLIIFWDTQANNAAPTLLATSNASLALLDDNIIGNVLLSPHNYRTKDRYKVLMDKMIIQNTADSTAQEQRLIKKNFRLGGAKIKFGGTGTTVANSVSRALYCWAINSNDGVATNGAWQFTARLWYTDQ